MIVRRSDGKAEPGAAPHRSTHRANSRRQQGGS
jgi:hypothetical protein